MSDRRSTYARKLALSTPTWLRCDLGLRAEIARAVLTEFERLMVTEGLPGFEQPRSAAIAHETGHAIVGAAPGDRISRVEVSRNGELERLLGIPAWGGFTYTKGKDGRKGWRADRDTPVVEIRARICRLEAGAVGEWVLDRGGYRNGSSLDERIVAQLIAAQLHERLGRSGHSKQTWRECWAWTAAVIEDNAEPARELMAKLDLMGRHSRQAARRDPGASGPRFFDGDDVGARIEIWRTTQLPARGPR